VSKALYAFQYLGDFMANTQKRKKGKTAQVGSEVLYQRIKQALENPNYKFRTIHGVIKEASVSPEVVERAMQEHSDEIVKLYRRGSNGEALYTTRKHYKKKASTTEKIIGAVINSVY
jgi:Fe-S cluster assembly scaffold protein SufB